MINLWCWLAASHRRQLFKGAAPWLFQPLSCASCAAAATRAFGRHWQQVFQYIRAWGGLGWMEEASSRGGSDGGRVEAGSLSHLPSINQTWLRASPASGWKKCLCGDPAPGVDPSDPAGLKEAEWKAAMKQDFSRAGNNQGKRQSVLRFIPTAVQQGYVVFWNCTSSWHLE